MKAIGQMTVEEMSAEMRKIMAENTYRVAERFIFVSYSHQDKAAVYPMVLGWMRDGYNVYIDLDFANHGSDQDWVEIMRDKIQDTDCALFVTFRSKSAAFSYATLLELLTVRMEMTSNYHDGNLPVDVVEVEAVEDGLTLHTQGVKKEDYLAYFEKLKKNIGDTFGKNNSEEYAAMKEGLQSFFIQKREGFPYSNVEQMMQILEKSYSKGASNFFSIIARFTLEWYRNNKLNGNTKSLDDSFAERFKNLGLEKKVPSIVATAEKESAARPAEKKAVPEERIQTVSAAESRQKFVKPAAEKAVETEKTTAKPVKAVEKDSKHTAQVPAVSAGGYPLFFKRSDKRTGYLMQTGEKEYVVLSGAEMRKDNTPTCPDSYIKLRNEVVARGGAIAWDDCYTLEEDVLTSSMSAAAGMLVCRSVNGKDFWLPCEDPREEFNEILQFEDIEWGDWDEELQKGEDRCFDDTSLGGGTYYVRKDGRPGRLKQLGDKEYVILPGAEMRKEQAPSCQYGKLREKIKAAGVLREEGENYVLVQEYTVTSLSAAAGSLTGNSVNGNTFWQVEERSAPAVSRPRSAADITIGELRQRFGSDEEFCIRVGELRRTALPHGGRGALDFVMATILGGCNEPSSKEKINYYKSAIANPNKDKNGSLGAFWTWSSNCRTLLYGSGSGSGRINADADAYYAALPADTTLGEILEKFEKQVEYFKIEKKDLTVECLKAFMQLL